MSDPRDVLKNELIEDLWGIGFTVVPRLPDYALLDVNPGGKPRGMAYQWCDKQNLDQWLKNGWKHVPASRHRGIYAPWGYSDDIEVSGLFLMEKSQVEVDAFHKASHDKAQQNVDDWYARQGAAGFTGGVTVLGEGSAGQSAEVADIGGGESSSRTKIPPDLFEHLPALMRERDRLVDIKLAAIADQGANVGNMAVLRAACLTQAIENIRSKLKDQANVESSGSAGRPERSEPGSAEGATEAGAEARPEAPSGAPDEA